MSTKSNEVTVQILINYKKALLTFSTKYLMIKLDKIMDPKALSNLDPNTEDINKAISEISPAFFLVKSSLSIHGIVEKVRECLVDEAASVAAP